MSQNRSHLRLVAAVAVAIFGIAGSVFAEQSPKLKRARPPVIVGEDGTTPGTDGRLTPMAAPAGTPVPFDTCSAPGTLTLNRTTKVDTTSAADDYQTLADPACYAGIGQVPTTAPGRDVVLSFTAPATGSYTFSIVHQNPSDANTLGANRVLYVSDSCPASGLVSCIKGSNRNLSRGAAILANGLHNNQSEQVSCVPMLAGQTYYVFHDDGAAANLGGTGSSVEVRECLTETEPNDTTATANPMACGIEGASHVAATAHCHLGFRGGSDPNGILNDGAVCTRSTPLAQTQAQSDARCDISGNPCSWDTTTGLDDCLPGEGHCAQTVGNDCDPHCTGGPNDGRACATNAFCNPGSAQNATCSGQCLYDATCIDIATGADTAVQCVPLCVGGTFNGRACASTATAPLIPYSLAAEVLSDCTGGGGVCTLSAMCSSGQTCGRVYNEGDADFFSLGVVPSGAKVFAGMDGKAANDLDWRLRVTTTTNTLQFDDDDGVSRNGTATPQIAGAPGAGTDTFLKVSRSSARASEPYLLYSIVQGTYPAQAQLEDEAGPVGNDIYFGWPGDILSANYINNTTGGNHGFIRGLYNGTHGGFAFDSDCFKFLVNEGDLMSWYGDGEPARNVTVAAQFPQPIIYDAEPAGISNFIFGANARKNVGVCVGGTAAGASCTSNAQCTGGGVCNLITGHPTLIGLAPQVTTSFFQWRAAYTGMLEVCFYDASAVLGLGTPGNGNWAGSLDVNCGPLQPAGPGTTTTDVSVEKTIFEGDGKTGTQVSYQIVVTNSSADIAQEVRLQDVLDPNLSFVSLTVEDGFGGSNTTCITTDGFSFFNGLPTPGTADVPIDCINTSMAPGTVTTYVLTVQVNNCIGAGIDITNTATILTASTDPNPGNDASSVMFTTTEDGTCQAMVCDLSGCVADLCNVNGACSAGSCVTEPADCNDTDECTQDSCDPALGCINDPGPIAGQCEDFVDCTLNGCDPATGLCVYTPLPEGSPCTDGLTCTSADHCDAGGGCVGTNLCDDGLPCTDDFAEEGNGCACTYAPTPVGTPCDDANPCTGNAGSPDGCDGANACAGGGPADCDDGDACTADSCVPLGGCVHTPLTCDDANACNGVETCAAASGCVAGTPPVCDDGDACNGLESCAPATGCAAGTPPTCNDNNACNGVETCAPATGCAAGTPLTCNDNNACNGVETCAPASGCVAGTPPTCNDNDACNGVETCVPATGCAAGTPPTCNDNDACNGVETCVPATGCAAGTPPTCNDNDVCNGVETCVPATGCAAGTPLGCNDGNPCNGVETCNPTTGCGPGVPLVCTPLDQCHVAGVCNPGTGVCSNPNQPNGTGCNDANGCTTNDACNTGTCVGGPPPLCDDHNDCTADACTTTAGCTVLSTDMDGTGFSLDRVDGRDLVVLADAYSACPGNPRYNPAANLDQETSSPDDCVDGADFHLFMNSFGRTCQ